MIKNPFDTPGKLPNLVCSQAALFYSEATRRAANLYTSSWASKPQHSWFSRALPEQYGILRKKGTPKWLFDTISCEHSLLSMGAIFLPDFQAHIAIFCHWRSWKFMEWSSHGLDLRLESPISFLSTAGCPEISSTAASHSSHSISACLAPYDWSWSPAESICWIPLSLPKMWCGCNVSETHGFVLEMTCVIHIRINKKPSHSINYRQDVVSLWSRSW